MAKSMSKKKKKAKTVEAVKAWAVVYDDGEWWAAEGVPILESRRSRDGDGHLYIPVLITPLKPRAKPGSSARALKNGRGK